MKIKSILAQNNYLLFVWVFIAAFGTYFCTYAFRKPYTTAGFEGHYFIGDIELKTALILSQILGYTISKFIGVKVISELKKKSRVWLILGLISFAQISLLFFAYVPPPYNTIFMLLNGLPLGMVWGVIFSFLEGRRFTEFLAIGLSINMIMTSGILKSFYLFVQSFSGLNEFVMPASLGFIFLPFLMFFVWMLSQIPAPNKLDLKAKMERIPMDREMKRKVLQKYGLGLFCVVFTYCFFTTVRDFRDNFMVEILQNLSYNDNIFIYARLEVFIAVIVMVLIASLVFFRRNLIAFNTINIVMIFSTMLILLSTLAFEDNLLSPLQWMACLGICFYLPYLMIQIAFFERLIAVFKINGNAGYFVYLCDSVGYLGSVILLLYKEFVLVEFSFAQVLIGFSKYVSIIAIILLCTQFIFFSYKLKKPDSKIVEFSN